MTVITKNELLNTLTFTDLEKTEKLVDQHTREIDLQLKNARKMGLTEIEHHFYSTTIDYIDVIIANLQTAGYDTELTTFEDDHLLIVSFA
jgi:hypothetical protein